MLCKGGRVNENKLLELVKLNQRLDRITEVKNSMFNYKCLK